MTFEGHGLKVKVTGNFFDYAISFMFNFLLYILFVQFYNTYCLWQGYGIFLILWQFLLPLVIFVVAYWNILGVIRRQAKVAADRHQITTKSKEAVAGTSAGTATAETAKAALSKDENQRDEVVVIGAVMASQRERGQVGNQQGSTSLSKAQINVVRTMIYITVCFTVCWMPMYTTVSYTHLTLPTILRV